MKCIVCNSTNLVKLPLINEKSKYTKISYPLYKCLNCGLIRPNPLPYDDSIESGIYDDSENIKFYDKTTGKIKIGKEYNYYFKHFKPYLSLIKKYKIKDNALDVGCGPGHLMALMSNEGLKVEGQDISPKIKEALKEKFKIYSSDLKSIKKKYDLITANQVIEHISDPEGFLKDINKLLSPKGYIIFATPYLYGLVPRILRTKWYGLGYGQHLNFFSKKSLKLLLEKTGYELKEFKVLIVDYAHPRFPKFLNLIAEFISFIIVKLGLGDNLFFVAQKRSSR